MGDRVAVMSDGVLQQCDTPRTLYDAPVNAFVAGFIGSPAMNLIEGRIVEDGVLLGSTVVPIPRELGQRARRRRQTGSSPSACGPSRSRSSRRARAFPAVVNVVEELGAEAYVYAQMADRFDRSVTAESDVIARVEPRAAPAIGELIHLRVKDGAMLLFDAESGARIT